LVEENGSRDGCEESTEVVDLQTLWRGPEVGRPMRHHVKKTPRCRPGSWYAGFIDSIPVGLFRTTLEGRLLLCNQAIVDLFGFDSASEMESHPVVELYRNRKDRGILIQAIIRAGRVTDLPMPFVKKTGEPAWCAVTARGVMDEDGMLAHIDGFVRDITTDMERERDTVQLHGRHETSKELVMLLDPQGREERFRGVLEMAGGVAHRLNQPLMIINNLLGDILSEPEVKSTHYEKLSKIQAQVTRLNELARKVGRIRKYEATDYVAGVRIVDIDRAS
jgi:PAS domain S-box-containing protein